ncbi:hypothetical protein D3C81_2098760 [compost metagenome]
MGMEFATVQRSPECLVRRRFAFRAVTEQAVVLPDHFAQRVMHGLQEVVVGGDHPAIG